MFETLISTLKVRTILVFVLVHVGLCFGIFALARTSFPDGWNSTSTFLALALAGLYGGFLLGTLFVILPLIPLVKKAQRVEHWYEKWIGDLPLLVEQFPKIIAAAQQLMAEWQESKHQKPEETPVKTETT